MNEVLKIENILGYVANDNPLRASRDGKEFEGLIPAPVWSEEIVKRKGTVTDTVREIKKVIKKYAWQTAALAPRLKGRNVNETCRNIWNFLFLHIKYKEDEEGQEQLRTPALSWYLRRIRGIDCDDFTIFAGCLLMNLNIPFYIRIARYPKKNYFQHVYNTIPFTNCYIVIDGVLDAYDTEKTPAETKDYLVMNTNNLNGIDISVLGGTDDDALNEISGILSGEDFNGVGDPDDLGSTATIEDELGAIRRHLVRTRNFIARRPHFIREVENPESFLGMIDYALKYWDTDKREQALGILEGEEERLNQMEGLSGAFEGHEDIEVFYGLNSLGNYDVLGKAKRQRKFFAKVKQAAKKAGQGIKKIARGVVRFNPATASIRAAVLLALKLNVLKVGSKLKFGYLTQDEARSKGLDLNEWSKLKEQVRKAEGMFVKVLAGKAENFKKAILSGRAGGLNGLEDFDSLNGFDGLGVVATAAAAGTTATAIPFLTKIVNLLKKVNFQKLGANLKKGKSFLDKFKKNKHKADEEKPTEENGSAMPEGGEAAEPPSAAETATPQTESEAQSNNETQSTSEQNSSEELSNKATTNTSNRTANTNSGSSNSSESNESESGSGENENLPATNARGVSPAARTTGEQVSFMTKAVDWVKINPGYSLLIAGTAAFLIYQAVKPKPRALGRAGKGKKKSGAQKTNPPKHNKGKGKGGKTVKL